MNIIKKTIIVMVVLALLLFIAYKVWITNNEENQLYIEETKEELENFEKRLIEDIETGDTDEPNNDESVKQIESIDGPNMLVDSISEKNTVETNDTADTKNNESGREIVSNKENQELPEKKNTETKKEISEIENIYNDAFSNLESKANQLLEDLISRAKTDYSNLSPDEKESEAVLSGMAADYLNRANELEDQIDEIFYNLSSKMENELIEKDLDKSIIKEYEEEYKERKKSRRIELMNKALEAQK